MASILYIKTLIDESKLSEDEKYTLMYLYKWGAHYFKCDNVFFLFSEDDEEADREVAFFQKLRSDYEKKALLLEAELEKSGYLNKLKKRENVDRSKRTNHNKKRNEIIKKENE